MVASASISSMAHPGLLAEHVRLRRRELGLSLRAVWDAGGPAVNTVRGIEAGSGPSPRNDTLRKLDHALAWESGTSSRLLGGHVLPEPQRGRRHATPADFASYEAPLLRPGLSDIAFLSKRASEIVGGGMQRDEPALTADEVRELDRVLRSQWKCWFELLVPVVAAAGGREADDAFRMVMFAAFGGLYLGSAPESLEAPRAQNRSAREH